MARRRCCPSCAPADLLRPRRRPTRSRVDPHKWLYAAVEAGCALVRHPGALRDAFAHTPPYYRFDGEAEDPRVNYYELGPQNSRGFRALKVWLALRQAGRDGYREMIGEDIRLARELDRCVRLEPRLEAWTQGLSITTFRYVPPDLRPAGGDRQRREAVEAYLNELNEELLHRLKTGGELFLSNAVVRETFLLRTCIVNFRTTQADVAAVPGIVAREGDASRRHLARAAVRGRTDVTSLADLVLPALARAGAGRHLEREAPAEVVRAVGVHADAAFDEQRDVAGHLPLQPGTR